MSTTYRIELACDHHEGAEFAAWLCQQGHNAHVGNSTGNYVDGESTSSPEASDLLRALWDEYCNG